MHQGHKELVFVRELKSGVYGFNILTLYKFYLIEWKVTMPCMVSISCLCLVSFLKIHDGYEDE